MKDIDQEMKRVIALLDLESCEWRNIKRMYGCLYSSTSQNGEGAEINIGVGEDYDFNLRIVTESATCGEILRRISFYLKTEYGLDLYANREDWLENKYWTPSKGA